MRLLVAISSRYYRTPDGRIWTRTAYDRQMWREVQEVFEELQILARVLDVHATPVGAREADHPGIYYCGVPEWRSWQAPLRWKTFLERARTAVAGSQALLLHSPSLEAELAYAWARKSRKPICVECRGEQAMSRAYWRRRGMKFSGLLSGYHKHQLHRHLQAAWGCVFVAEQLKDRYAPFLRKGAHTAVISDVRLPAELFRAPRMHAGRPGKRLRLVNVGRLEAQKSPTTLLQACSLLSAAGLDNWELHLIGEGPLLGELRGLARALQIEQQVVFHGFIPWGEELFPTLDEMDLFLLSSLSEGMPRALLEAMARGLPCLSTQVSGADELLGREALVPIGRADVLAARIVELVRTPGALDRLANQCSASARAYQLDRLRVQKQLFLQAFREHVCQLQKCEPP